MVKFTFGDNEGKTNLGLGVTRENINRLVNGQPIRVRLDELNIKVDGAIMIYYGETEQELYDAVKEFIGPKTKLQIDPRIGGFKK